MLLATEGSKATATIASPLRWAGGKRWLFSRYRKLFTGQWNRYIEPFVGGGAVLFGLNPRTSVVCDANKRLIATYEAIAWNASEVYACLKEHSLRHSKAYYYQMRTTPPAEGIDLAAWFLYLNRTAFGGLYRVNRRNEFNVPFGDSRRLPGLESDLLAAGTTLRRSELICGDFTETLSRVTEGSLVYLDPPYALPAIGRDFRRYNDEVFNWNDQMRLAEFVRDVLRRGAEIAFSNAHNEVVRELFEPTGLVATTVARRASLDAASDTSERTEYLFLSHGLLNSGEQCLLEELFISLRTSC